MQKSLNKTGTMRAPRHHGNASSKGNLIPLRQAWISDELLMATQRVWGKEYGRPVTETEAIEILVNVKHMAEALQKAKTETKKE